METYTDALNYILSCIERDPDDARLTVTLSRLARLTASREDGPELLEGFNDAYYGQLSEVRYRRQLEAAVQGKN